MLIVDFQFSIFFSPIFFFSLFKLLSHYTVLARRSQQILLKSRNHCMVLYSPAIITLITFQLYDLLWKCWFDFGAGALGQRRFMHHWGIPPTRSTCPMPLRRLIRLQRDSSLISRLLVTFLLRILMLELATFVQDSDWLRGLESCANHGLLRLRRYLLDCCGDLFVAEHGGDGGVCLVDELGWESGRSVAAQSWLADACVELLFGDGRPFCDLEIGESLECGLVVWARDRGCVPWASLAGVTVGCSVPWCFIVRDRCRANRLNCVVTLERIDIDWGWLALIHDLLLKSGIAICPTYILICAKHQSRFADKFRIRKYRALNLRQKSRLV